MGEREKVRQIIRKLLNVKDFKDTDDLNGYVLCAGELDMIEVCMAFEEEWGIDISDEEAEAMVTVKDAIELVERKTR